MSTIIVCLLQRCLQLLAFSQSIIMTVGDDLAKHGAASLVSYPLQSNAYQGSARIRNFFQHKTLLWLSQLKAEVPRIWTGPSGSARVIVAVRR